MSYRIRLYKGYSLNLQTADSNTFQYEKHWKRYLTVLWISQFLFQASFQIGLPFVAYYMQTDLGVFKDDVPFWVALFGAGPALTTLLFSPFWGAMANRYGYKRMLLRCYLSGVIVLSGMAFCKTPGGLVFFRFLQGVVCGSIPVALSLASSQAPRNRIGFAMGAINSSTYSGLLCGSFFGGIFADAFGYRNAFLFAGCPSLISAVLLWFFVQEHFIPPAAQGEKANSLGTRLKSMSLNHHQRIVLTPLLIIMGIVMFGRCFDTSFFALYVQEIRGTIVGSAKWTGFIQGLAGVAGVLAGFCIGYLSDRFEPGKLAISMSLIAALLLGSLYLAPLFGATFGIIYLAVMRTCSNLAVDGIEPSLQIWLARKTGTKARNLAFAWAFSIRSIGMFLAPFAAGFVIYRTHQVRTIFIAGACIFLLIALFIHMSSKRQRAVLQDGRCR